MLNVTCFYSFFRVGELQSRHLTVHRTYASQTCLCMDCIHNPQVIKLRLKAFKTDPFRQGVDVVLGRTHTDTCPVTALLAYLALIGNNPGCLFQFADDGRLLTKHASYRKFEKPFLPVVSIYHNSRVTPFV